MGKIFVSSALVLLLASTHALGADLAIPAPAPPLLYGWTGCYVGVAGGYARGISNAKSDGTSPLGTIPRNITGNYAVSGGIAGGTAGCNLFQAANWVLGVESDFSWTDKTGSGPDLPPFLAGTTNTTTEQWLSTERLRMGYTFNNWLIYATGGFALAQVQYSIANPTTIVGGSVSETHTLDGWTAGAGVEWAFGGGWSAKAEYLYVDFGRTPYFNFNGSILTTSPTTFIANRNGGVFLDDNIVRVGVNYKFNAATLFGHP